VPKGRIDVAAILQQQRYDDEGEAPIHDHDAVAQSIESTHTNEGSVRSNTHAIATARVRLGSVVSAAAMRQPVRNRTTKPVKKAISPMKMGETEIGESFSEERISQEGL
jgi:hypothetical protein